jgi:CRP-like cAMP-binding protein
MVSPELLRRYPFFSCLSHDQLATLAMAGQEITVEARHHFFMEGDKLRYMYFLLEGNVDITIGVPDRKAEQDVREQIMGNFIAEDIVVSHIVPGQLFGWSAMIPPNTSTAGAVSVYSSRVVAFDCEALMQVFEEDCPFANLMLQKVAKVIRARLRDMRIQSLAFVPS